MNSSMLLGVGAAVFGIIIINQFKAGREFTGGILNNDNRYFN